MKIKHLKKHFPPSDYQRSQMENPPKYRFKEKPVYDEKGNIIDVRLPHYDPLTPPLAEDIECDTSFDLKDPSTFAAVITGNSDIDIPEQSPYDAFSATSAVQDFVNNLPTNNPT